MGCNGFMPTGMEEVRDIEDLRTLRGVGEKMAALIEEMVEEL